MLDHPADLLIEITSDDRLGLFQSGVEAMINVLTESRQPDQYNLTGYFEATGEGTDDEIILVSLLNDFLYQVQVYKKYPLRVNGIYEGQDKIIAKINYLTASKDFIPVREIKAVTYHDIFIKRKPIWQTKIVLDV